MLELAEGLPPRTLRAIAELERRVVTRDGGRLKLEWSVLRARAGSKPEDVLWWEGDRLLGFLGLYAFGPPNVELAGMVDPDTRRCGIGRALLDAALPLCRQRGYAQALLVVPRDSVGGAALARSMGAALEHSEHALVLTGMPAEGPADPRITVRATTPDDLPRLAELLTAAFGAAPGNLSERLADDTARTVMIDLDARPVGTMWITQDDDTGGVYGFAVDPAFQGRGIGRDVLRRACRGLVEDGARRVGLEVAVDNEHALGLYTSLGFEPVTTEDYWAVPLS